LESFTAALTRAPSVRVALVVSDLDLSAVRSGSAVIAGVTFVRAGNNAESVLDRLLPGSGFLVDRLDAFAHPGETAVAWSDANGWASSARSGDSAKRRIGQVLTALRLITGTTAHGLVMAYGSPDPVVPFSPTVTRLPHAGSLRMIYRDTALGTPTDEDLERLLRGDLRRVFALDERESDLAFALARFNRAATDHSLTLIDRIVELSIALEAALGGPDRSDVSLRLRTRAAALLASAEDQAESIYDAVKILYDLRSRVVHGDPAIVRELTRTVGRVQTRVRSRWEGEQLQLVYDRFSDIVRRAIAARIALGSGGGPWPWSGRAPDVDRFLSAPASRSLMKRRVTNYWAARHLQGATRPATPAVGLLGRRTP
jgi:hypothetical protein